MNMHSLDKFTKNKVIKMQICYEEIFDHSGMSPFIIQYLLQ